MSTVATSAGYVWVVESEISRNSNVTLAIFNKYPIPECERSKMDELPLFEWRLKRESRRFNHMS